MVITCLALTNPIDKTSKCDLACTTAIWKIILFKRQILLQTQKRQLLGRPHLGQLQGVCHEYFREIWPCYNEIPLFLLHGLLLTALDAGFSVPGVEWALQLVETKWRTVATHGMQQLSSSRHCMQRKLAMNGRIETTSPKFPTDSIPWILTMEQ